MNKKNDEAISILEQNTGYSFKDKALPLEALTHTSFSNEMKINKRDSYERLEFLGDAVLQIISSEFLYFKYPEKPEGFLSKTRASIVCEPSLSRVSNKLGLGELLFLGKGEENLNGRDNPSILCDVCESVLGAIYLDGGFEPAKKYVHSFILSELKPQELFTDYKSAFNEYIAHEMPTAEVMFDIIDEIGPEHDKQFVAGIFIDKVKVSEGTGHTKKAAHQSAAYSYLKDKGITKERI